MSAAGWDVFWTVCLFAFLAGLRWRGERIGWWFYRREMHRLHLAQRQAAMYRALMASISSAPAAAAAAEQLSERWRRGGVIRDESP